MTPGTFDEAVRHLSLDPAAVVEASADGLLLVDGAGVIRYANRAAGELFGHAPEDLLGQEFGHPVTAGDSTQIDVAAGGHHRVLDMRVTEVRLDPSPVLVVALRDVTEHRRTADALTSALMIRDHSAELVLHELKNPVTALVGYASTLHQYRDRMAPADQQRLFDNMRRLGDRVLRMTQSLTHLARLDVEAIGDLAEPVALSAALERAVTDAIEGTSHERDDLLIADAGDVVVLSSDGHVEHMVSNCIRNAFRHGEPPITISVARSGRFVEIRVSDHGDGVPEHERDQLFEEFVRGQATTPGGGLGLGLALTRRLARLHGGDVTYEDDGPGATFCIRLPAADAKGRGTNGRSQQASRARANRRRHAASEG